MLLSDLIAGLDVRAVGGPDPRSVRVCDITEDSRTVMPGSLFVARSGTKHDGRAFIDAAITAGAAAILTEDRPGAPAAVAAATLTSPDLPRAVAALAERFYGSPSKSLSLIGVTGTNGKTTIAHLCHQMMNAARRRCGLIGTVHIDDGVETAPASMTTPGAIELSRLLARMADVGCEACAMEVSSHALHQARAAALEFDAAVFTNLTGDHLDYHGTMEDYAAAKALLFESLAPSAVAVVNHDDPWTPRMIQRCRARIVLCSMADPSADCRARALESTSIDTLVELVGPWGRLEARVPLVGRHNVMNVLQAAAACVAAGLPADQLAHALTRIAPPPGRLERVAAAGAPAPFSVVVDYAHSDDSLAKALESLRPLVAPGASLWCVFGCGGDRDRTKRPRMGATAAKLADRLVVTSDNPRTERPEAILDEILAGIPAGDRRRAHADPDRAAAIRHAVDHAQPGDIVLIAGKGHEDYQILPDGRGGTVSRHFDDRQEARAALAHRFKDDQPDLRAQTRLAAGERAKG